MSDVNRDNLLDDLSAYLDGELSQARAAEVDRLLAESPDARAVLAGLREVREQVRGLPVRRAPAQLSAGLDAALRAHAAGRAVWPRRVLQLGVPLAAAAAAVLAVGIFLHRQALPQAGTTSVPQIAKRLAVSPPGPPAPEPTPPMAAVEPERDFDAEKLESQGWADALVRTEPQPALAIALDSHVDEAQPAVEPQPLALAIHPRSDAEHAQYAALLASWSPAESSVTNGQGVEYVYQLALPDVSVRVAQLLDVRTAAEEASPAMPISEQQPAARPMAAKPERRRKEAPAAEKRGEAAPAGGAAGNVPGQGPPRRLIIGDQREEAARVERAHAQHAAVTEEPEITVMYAPSPPAAPTSQAGAARDAAENERLLELLLGGELPAWATSRPASAATQTGAPHIALHVELRPATTATAPASRPAR